MAAVLTCGPTAVLSHVSAAALWGARPVTAGSRGLCAADGTSSPSRDRCSPASNLRGHATQGHPGHRRRDRLIVDFAPRLAAPTGARHQRG